MDCPVLGGEPQDTNCHGCVCEECALSVNYNYNAHKGSLRAINLSKRSIPITSQAEYATQNDLKYVLGLIDEIRDNLPG